MNNGEFQQLSISRYLVFKILVFFTTEMQYNLLFRMGIFYRLNYFTKIDSIQMKIPPLVIRLLPPSLRNRSVFSLPQC